MSPGPSLDTSRLVICTADVGCGHARAAGALALALRELAPGPRVPIIDAMADAPRWFTMMYRDAYLFAARKLPKLNGMLYERTDVPGVPSSKGMVRAIEASAMRHLASDPSVRSASVIVCTHFLCARVLARLRAKGLLSAKIVVVVTDQHPHAVWRIAQADLYLVASESARTEMLAQGIDPSRLLVTGIPIDARFTTDRTQLDARAKHELPTDRKLILITGGGLGLGGLDEALDGVLSTNTPALALVVCGRNQALHARLTQRVRDQRLASRAIILGHTIHMHELMNAADVMVCKPGGLTTAEATALGLPMVLLRPIPGQEDRNARVLVNCGAACFEPDPFDAGAHAAKLVDDTQSLNAMRTASRRFGKADAAALGARAILNLLQPQHALVA